MKILFFILISVLCGCTHKFDGVVLKDSHGDLYQLRGAAADETYELHKIDSIELRKLLSK